MGKALIDQLLSTLTAMGSPGVHLGAGLANVRARRFYEIYGFRTVERPAGARSRTVWMQYALG